MRSAVSLCLALIGSISATIGAAFATSGNTEPFKTRSYVIAWDDSYNATIITFAHGWLTVIDDQCHHHTLWASLTNRPSLSAGALRNWGWQHTYANVRIYSHMEGVPPDLLEVPEQIVLRQGDSDIEKCDKETRSFEAHVDGKVIKWDEGNAFGGFTLRLSSGATRDFAFTAGREPLVNGHRVFCEALNHNCPALLFKNALVRVYYKIVDSPDGPTVMPLRIESVK